MRSGSGNVTLITFEGFTLLDQFCQLFEAFTAAGNPRQAAFNSPYYSKLYTKAGLKANPTASRRQTSEADKNGAISTAAARRRFHLA
jgi:hypothetical protein